MYAGLCSKLGRSASMRALCRVRRHATCVGIVIARHVGEWDTARSVALNMTATKWTISMEIQYPMAVFNKQTEGLLFGGSDTVWDTFD